jgi:uncharacterized membrane protein
MYLVVFMVSVMVLYHLYICFSGVHGWRDGVVPPVHMYLVVFMVSLMVLYHLYICIYWQHHHANHEHH